MMDEARAEIREAVRTSADEFFAGQVDRTTLDASEAGLFQRDLWVEMAAMGLTTASLSETSGGIGSLRDAAMLLRVSGYHAVPVPLAEALLAAWLAEHAGIQVSGSVLTLGRAEMEMQRVEGRWVANGTISNVPWARDADAVGVIADVDGVAHLAILPIGDASIVRARNIAGEPRDHVVARDVEVAAAPLPFSAGRLRAITATMRAAQMAGALERLLELTVSYANERVQFGKPIGKFQAIQQQIAILANHTAASIMAAERALDVIEEAGVERLGAIAKVRVGEGASEGARIAHQVHGAMGFTHEHILHHFTRRLWAWRDEHGSEAEWARHLGAAAIAGGPAAFWDFVGEAA